MLRHSVFKAACFCTTQLVSSHQTEREEVESRFQQELVELTEQHNTALGDMKSKHAQDLQAAEAKIKDLKEELVSQLAKGNFCGCFSVLKFSEHFFWTSCLTGTCRVVLNFSVVSKQDVTFSPSDNGLSEWKFY